MRYPTFPESLREVLRVLGYNLPELNYSYNADSITTASGVEVCRGPIGDGNVVPRVREFIEQMDLWTGKLKVVIQ